MQTSEDVLPDANEALQQAGRMAAAAMQQLAEAVTRIIEQLQPMLQEYLESVLQTAQQVYQLLWERYREVGAPYGESDAGLRRWLRECAEAQHLELAALRIREHHQMLADARAMRQRLRQQRGV